MICFQISIRWQTVSNFAEGETSLAEMRKELTSRAQGWFLPVLEDLKKTAGPRDADGISPGRGEIFSRSCPSTSLYRSDGLFQFNAALPMCLILPCWCDTSERACTRRLKVMNFRGIAFPSAGISTRLLRRLWDSIQRGLFSATVGLRTSGKHSRLSLSFPGYSNPSWKIFGCIWLMKRVMRIATPRISQT